MTSISVGKYTYINQGIGNIRHFGDLKKGKIVIGKYNSIGKNLTLFLNENHPIDSVTTYPFGHLHTDIFPNINPNKMQGYGNGDIIIENDVWIGENTTIMSGVKIHNGAIVAANSHVVKDCPPYSICGGNPAKIIKYRFNKNQINNLLKIKWWDLDETIINKKINLLIGKDINKFIDSFNGNDDTIIQNGN
jgi:virginiamycin A acetyltransferase